MSTWGVLRFLFVLVILTSASFGNAKHIRERRDTSSECGLSIDPDKFTTLIAGGSSTRRGEFPWLAAIYLKSSDDKWSQICAGTLVSPQIVLTVAHCLIHGDGPIKPEDMKIGFGKYQRDYDNFENDSLIADVKEFVTPDNYRGATTGYALDIGLVVLKEKVHFTPYIRPVCLDWSSVKPKTGDIGHFAGWGLTEAGVPSETVLSAKLSYLSNTECIKGVRPDLYRFIPLDKFCVASKNGTQAGKGDTGGAMTMLHEERHHLVGVLSSKLVGADNDTTLFTDVLYSEHQQWLQDQMARLEKV